MCRVPLRVTLSDQERGSFKGLPLVSCAYESCRAAVYEPTAGRFPSMSAMGLVLGRAFLLRQLFRKLGELWVEFRKLFGEVVEGFLQLFVV